MAQGCHLIYSVSDREHFNFHDRPERTREAAQAAALSALGLLPDSVDQRLFEFQNGVPAIDRTQCLLHGIEQHRLDCFVDRFNQMPLEDQKTIARIAATKSGWQRDLLLGLGNPALSPERALLIPKALDRIWRHSPNAPGLFSRLRPGASAWVSNLKNSGEGKADGVANEVIATAALLDQTIKSRDGKTLHIGLTDQVSGFGLKYQASYGARGPIAVTDGQTRSVFYQPKRSTVEADLVITRPVGILPGSTIDIAVDFKLSTTASPTQVTETQLEGVLVALKTGEVDAFYFATNTHFDNQTVALVQQINRRIESINRENGDHIEPIELFEHFDAHI